MGTDSPLQNAPKSKIHSPKSEEELVLAASSTERWRPPKTPLVKKSADCTIGHKVHMFSLVAGGSVAPDPSDDVSTSKAHVDERQKLSSRIVQLRKANSIMATKESFAFWPMLLVRTFGPTSY